MVLDSGLTPLNGTATVFIDVIEINSHRPDFTPNFYNMEVKSDTNAGEIVLILAADDADTGLWLTALIHRRKITWIKVPR